MDKVIEWPGLKAVGHQLYWSHYEYSDYGAGTIEFDSSMVPTSGLNYLRRVTDWTVSIQAQAWVSVTVADLLLRLPYLLKLTQFQNIIQRSGVFYCMCQES